MHQASGYPLCFTVTGRGRRWEYATRLADQPYLHGRHIRLPAPHVYADIMDLVMAVAEDRPPRAAPEQARHVVEIIEKAQIAAQTGRAQDLTTVFTPVPFA